MRTSIAVYQDDSLLARITITEGILDVRYFNQSIAPKLGSMLDNLKEHTLHVLKEIHDKDGGIYIVQQPVVVTDSLYPQALVNELQSQGFSATVVDSSLMDQIEEHVDEWRTFLKKTTDEILKNSGTI